MMNRRSFLHSVGKCVSVSVGVGAALTLPASLFSSSAQAKTLFANNPRQTPMRGFGGQDVASENILIEGKIPAELRGVFFRNGPGLFERGGQRYQHWFDGDGLVNAWRFTDSGVSHQARFVRTEKFIAENAAGEFLVPAFGSAIKAKKAIKNSDSTNTANTNGIPVCDKLLAMWEGGSAYELDAKTLTTRGVVTWAPELKSMPFSAHPKVEADGTFWNFGTLFGKMVVYHISAQGVLLRHAVFDTPSSAMVHDFAVSQRHLIFLMPPIALDREALKAGKSFGEAMTWKANDSVKIMIVEKADFSQRRVLELPAFMVYHFGNAWEQDDVIRVDFVKSENLGVMNEMMPKMMRGESPDYGATLSTAAFLSIDLRRGKTSITTRTEPVEFPRVDPRYVAQRNRYVWYPTSVGQANTGRFNSVMRIDTDGGKKDVFTFSDDVYLEEHVVVPKPGSSKEGEGWLVGVGFDVERQQTFATVFDALNLISGPIAQARLPYWVPYCFHGNFLAA
jgi:all-trans-8'-apo-beta-carotenal 15,15'-oxygenase